MTTDAEIKAASDFIARSYRSGMTLIDICKHPEYRSDAWFIAAYMETAERREKLFPHIIQRCQIRLDFSIGKRRRWAEGGYGVVGALKEMEEFVAHLDGTEKIDTYRLNGLLGDLRALHAEQQAFKKALRSV